MDTNCMQEGSVETTKSQGCVKWFNNKTGYGFLTIIQDSEWGADSEKSRVGQDVFAHHSAIVVEKEQYRYLVQGEYVTFHLISTDEGEHKFQASNITGVAGGKLMCETRNEQRLSRQEDGDDNDRRPPRRRNVERVRVHGEGVREGEIWTLEKRRVGGRGRGNGRGRQNRNLDEDN